MTIDVIIPTIGRPSLVRAVKSVVDQSVDCRAIVVLDRPDQISAVSAMLNAYPHKLLLTSGRSKAATARNLGLDAATAPVVAFLDDDDWWEPRRAERLAARFASVSGDFLIASPFLFTFPNGKTRVVPTSVPPFSAPAMIRVNQLSDYLVTRSELRFGNNALQTSSLMMSAALARRVRWDHDLPKHQDWDFILRATKDTDVALLWDDGPDCHVLKDSPGSISRSMNWRASLLWLERHEATLGAKARSDFAWVHVLRAALATRSVEGLREFVRLKPALPHASAMIIGLEGLRTGFRSKR